MIYFLLLTIIIKDEQDAHIHIIMKTFFTTITKTLIITLALAASTTLAFAASFDSNPSGNTGITSINNEGALGGQYNFYAIPDLDPGESTTIDVMTDYMAQQGSSEPVYNARVRYITQNISGSNPSFDFAASLSASNATSRSDTARVNNLPSEWTIEAISARVVNTQGQGGDTQDSNCGNVNYNQNAFSSIFSGGYLLGTLSNANNGWCDQGTAIVTYRITNDEQETEPSNTYSWSTGDWGACINGIEERSVVCVNDQTGNTVSDSLCGGAEPADSRNCDDGGNEPSNTYSWSTGDWGACINGIEERSVVCVNDQTGNTVSDSLCGGAEPADSRNCDDSQGVLDIDTDFASNIGLDSAQLNGDLISGGPADLYWFVLSSTDSSPECEQTSDDLHIYGISLGGGNNPSFLVNQTGLQEDTQYWYKACASLDGNTFSGNTVSFNTDNFDDPVTGNGEEPDVDTENPDNVDEDSAELNGFVDMNDFSNGVVFYVYGQDESAIENVEFNYNEYSQIDQDGDDLRKFIAESDLDSQGTFPEDVNGLDRDETYYYQICVEYEVNEEETLACGGVESFSTDDDDNNNSGDIDIETDSPEDIGNTFAVLCGDLRDDGGDNSLRTRIEVRPSNSSFWTGSSFEQRGEGPFCVRVNNLTPNTDYRYRACTDENECGNTRSFRTNPVGVVASAVNVNTLSPTNITRSSAVLNGRYQGSSTEPTQVWFEWGTTPNLGVQKQIFNRSAIGGDFLDSFTGLRSCQTYYYRAVARNSSGIRYGNTLSFRTLCSTGGGGGGVVVIQEQVEETEIDLESLGLGLSLLRLDIDNDQENLFRDQSVQYEVTWENISRIDLDDIDVKVTVPEELSVTSISRGRYDAEDHVVLFNIDELDAGEDGDMTISGIINNGRLGDLVTAEATAAYNNPINDAQENATDYDIDEFVLNTNFGTASVFGLSNITFLGWLTILLGLLIIFLIARWLYLEREELRAQAYANGYRPQGLYGDPRYDYYRGPQALGGYTQEPPYQDRYYDTPAVSSQDNQNYPQQGAQQNPQGNQGGAPDDGYQPYRPNRG
jgi:hypothetical protein